VQNAVYMKGLT